MKQIILNKKLSFSESIEIAIRLYLSQFFYLFTMTSYFFIPYILLRLFLYWQILPLDITSGNITSNSSLTFQAFSEIFIFSTIFIIIFLLVLCFFTLIFVSNGLLMNHRFSFQHSLHLIVRKIKTILVNSYLFVFLFTFLIVISLNFVVLVFVIPFAVLLPFIFFPQVILFEKFEYLHAFRRSAQIVKYRYLFFFSIIVFICFAVLFIANSPQFFYVIPKTNEIMLNHFGPQKAGTPDELFNEIFTVVKNMPLYFFGFCLMLEFLLFPILPILSAILYQNTISIFENKQKE